MMPEDRPPEIVEEDVQQVHHQHQVDALALQMPLLRHHQRHHRRGPMAPLLPVAVATKVMLVGLAEEGEDVEPHFPHG